MLVLSIICSKCKNEDEKNISRKIIYSDIKNSWFNWKHIITFKIWVKNLDWKKYLKYSFLEEI